MAQTTTQIATDAITALTSSTSAVTNFNVGSLNRGLIDGFSAEASVIEQQIEAQTANAILNALYQLLDLQPTGAIGSVYSLTFSLASSASASYTLAAGSAVTIPNSSLQWLTGQSITIAPGGSQTITATCSTTGSITNVPANTITQLVVPVSGLSVTNPSAQPTVLGRDAETQVQLQAQLSGQINQLHRGDYSAVESGAITSQLVDASGNPTEQVVKAREADSNTYGLGYCYVFNGSGPMSSALLSQTQNVINGYTDTSGVSHIGYKAAGVTMTVVDAPETVVNVAVAVLPKAGYTLAAVQGGVQTAVQAFLTNLDLGGIRNGIIYGAVSTQQLAYAILAVPGVADVQITSPSTSLPGVPYVTNPTSAPVLTAVAGSTSFSAATYTVGYTWTNVWGETVVSPTSAIALTAGQAIQVGALTLPVGASGVNYYLSGAGTTTVYLDASGTGAQITLTTAPTGTVQPPNTSTAQIFGNAYILGTLSITQASS